MKQGQASATAKVIAASTVLLASQTQTQHLVPPQAAQLCREFLSQSATDHLLRWSAVNPVTRLLWLSIERLTHPGIMGHYWLRKRWIEQRCHAAIASGVQRVVIIGAGFDTLALRLASQYPHVQWVEIDHPNTQAAKRTALLNTASHPAQASIQFFAVDLSQHPLPVALRQCPAPTLVIIEGVLMYLKSDTVKDLLGSQIKSLSLQPIHLIFSSMVRWPDGRTGFRPASWWVDFWLAWREEKFQWSLPPDAVADWLQSCGYSVVSHAHPPFDYCDKNMEIKNLLQGEQLIEAIAHKTNIQP